MDLLVERGDRLALLGPNGAGKTTLFNVIAGDISPTAGRVVIKGIDCTELPARFRPRLGVTFTDITDRIEAEAKLQRTLEDLDERVRERTSELSRANETLRREVEERVRLEAQERAQRSHAEALRDTAAAVARSLQLDDVIEQVLIGVERLCDHGRSYVAFYDNEGVLELAGERFPGRLVPARAVR